MVFQNIFRAEPPINSGYHFGSRLVIKDKYLFISAGERGKGMIAQDANKHPGSIIRINLDGSIPKDNPKFKGKKNWMPEIFQIGVRNPQGIALSPFNDKIYITNHGAKGGDWFGTVNFGGNYGWKILGWGGTNYSGTKIGPKWKPGFTKAIKYWVPSIAVSAMTIYKGNTFKEWNGDALITSLKDQSLRKIKFKDNKFHGQGTYTWANENKYVGEYKDDKRNGQGTFYFNDGIVWDGQWEDGECPDCKYYAKGEYNGSVVADNECPGSPLKKKYSSIPSSWHNCEGTFVFTDKGFENNKYLGEFKDGQPNGQGTYYFLADNENYGDKYAGQFKDGIIYGQGTYYFLADNEFKGDKYEGEYKDGNRNGQGTYTFADGRIVEGQWRNGKYVGKKEYEDEVLKLEEVEELYKNKIITEEERQKMRNKILVID